MDQRDDDQLHEHPADQLEHQRLSDLARRALVASKESKDLFVSPTEMWLLKRMEPVQWEEAVLAAARELGMKRSGATVHVVIQWSD